MILSDKALVEAEKFQKASTEKGRYMLNLDKEVYRVSVEGENRYDDFYNEERIELRITFLDGPQKGETIIKDIPAERLDKQ